MLEEEAAGELMFTEMLPCGCMVTHSLFGSRTILTISFCHKHSAQFDRDTKALLAGIVADIEKSKESGEPLLSQITKRTLTL